VIYLAKELYFFLLIELLAVGWLDFKQKKILNIWPLLNIAIFIMNIIFFRDLYTLSWGLFYYPLIFFIVGFAFFLIKIMGGGDSKFLVSIFILIPQYFHENFFICLLYVTIIVGSIQFFYNAFSGRKLIFDFLKYKDTKYLKKCFGKKFPFAPLIFLSWIIFGMNNIGHIK